MWSEKKIRIPWLVRNEKEERKNLLIQIEFSFFRTDQSWLQGRFFFSFSISLLAFYSTSVDYMWWKNSGFCLHRKLFCRGKTYLFCFFYHAFKLSIFSMFRLWKRHNEKEERKTNAYEWHFKRELDDKKKRKENNSFVFFFSVSLSFDIDNRVNQFFRFLLFLSFVVWFRSDLQIETLLVWTNDKQNERVERHYLWAVIMANFTTSNDFPAVRFNFKYISRLLSWFAGKERTKKLFLLSCFFSLLVVFVCVFLCLCCVLLVRIGRVRACVSFSWYMLLRISNIYMEIFRKWRNVRR